MLKTFKIRILGCAAALPTSTTHTTAQWLQVHNQNFLLDCAEGTQMLIRKAKLPMMKIENIFISHLHGDHYLGLPGLLFSYHLLGREKELNIYSPPGLEEIINTQLRISNVKTRYKTVFHEIKQGKQLLFENEKVFVESIEMKHSIPCFGFLISEKPHERNIKKDCIKKYNFTILEMKGIKQGKDYIDKNNNVILNEKLTISPPPVRKYAFCSDTVYDENCIDQIKNADLLYHEATFLQDKAEIAKEKMHSTAAEAAKIAKKANVKTLILGHYSARYDDINEFKKEASQIFPNTIIAEEGLVIDI
ncbi:MAG: ribonuclease Z [Bacteroidota bacterium]